MRAFVLTDASSSPRAADLPDPKPGAGEVRVRVVASSVNPHDALVASGEAARYMAYRYPVVLGSDLAGVVDAVGAGVDDVMAGDRVFGLVRERVAARGSFAEAVVVPRDWVTLVPDGVDDAAAGAFGLAALTALRCVQAVDPAVGDVVLVNGATGGVGSYAVQLLAARGATVLATARLGDQAAHVRTLGASDVLDRSAADVAQAVLDQHPGGVAAVIDLVTRDRDALTALATRVLAPGGRLASTRHAADPERLLGALSVNVIAQVDQQALRTIAELAASGRLRAPITRTFGFDELGAAFSALGEGVVGKLAVRI